MKERLIGAAVLVALGVIAIPWLLDGRSDPAADGGASLELPTPDEAAPIRSQTLRLGVEPVSAAAGGTESAPAEQGGEAVAAATSVPEPVEPVARAVESAPPAAAPAPQVVASAAVSTTATGGAGPDAAGEGWVVQIGAFGDEANAKRQVDRVAAYGHRATVSRSRTDAGVRYRVRIGPRPTRAEADTVASVLKAHGFVAQVMAAD